MRGVRGFLLLLALLGVCAFLAVGVMSALRPIATPPAPTFGAGGSAPEVPRLAAFSAVDLGDLTDAVDRPPFSQSRRPAAAPAIPEASPENLNATLSGVILSAEDRVAILSSAEDGEPVRLREGDVYLGWTLVEVEADAVLMERDGREQRLGLSFKGPPVIEQPEERRRRVREPAEAPKE